MSKAKDEVLKQSLYMDHPIGKKERQKKYVCRTVKELRKALANFPDDLPLANDFEYRDGISIQWSNFGVEEPGMVEHLSIEEFEAGYDDE